VRSLILNLVFLALAGITSIAVAASKPVILTSAPNPELSQAAWAQIVARHKVGKTTEFKVAIQVKNGSVTGVQIVDPCGADLVEQDVRNWVLKKWRFEPDFSGDKVQLMAFNLESKKEQETKAAKARRAADAHHGLLLRSPVPLDVFVQKRITLLSPETWEDRKSIRLTNYMVSSLVNDTSVTSSLDFNGFLIG
jgi:hypothetical protein